MLQLAEAMNEWYRIWIWTAAYTGLRWSETLGVQRSDIDAQRRLAALDGAYTCAVTNFERTGTRRAEVLLLSTTMGTGRRQVVLVAFSW